MKVLSSESLGLVMLLALMVVGADSSAQTVDAAAPKPKSQRIVLENGRTMDLKVVRTAEQHERRDIESSAFTLLINADYDGLEKFAGDLRASKKTWADGNWKLANVYSGLLPRTDKSPMVWDDRIDKVRSWVAARPESITARIALAYAEVDYAWYARGSGVADSVTDDGWRLFHQRLVEAVKILDEAKKLQAKCPIYWRLRLRAALGLSENRQEYDALFAEARRSWPDCVPIYYSRAIYLLPRWLGAPGESANDLADSANKIGGQAGDELYAQVVWSVDHYAASENVIEENNFSWPRVDRGFQDIEKLYPNSLAALSEHAYLAVMARDREQAHKCFEALNGTVDSSVWESQEQFTKFAIWSCGGKLVQVSGGTVKEAKPSREPAPVSQSAAVKPESQPELVLKGISGPPGRRLAVINNLTFGVGESGKVRVRNAKVEVVCKEIRDDDSVLVAVDGKLIHLELAEKSITPTTDKVARK